MRARLAGLAAVAIVTLWSSAAFADAIVITGGHAGANWDGSLSPNAVTIALFLTISATPFCCAEAYW